MTSSISDLGRLAFITSVWIFSQTAAADDAAIQSLDQASKAQAAALDLLNRHHAFEEDVVKRESDRLTIFFSTRQAENLNLSGMSLLIDGQRVTSHRYSPEEQRGLQGRAVQMIHTGRIESGVHEIQFTLELDSGASISMTPRKFSKGRQDKFIEIQLTGGTVRSFAEIEW